MKYSTNYQIKSNKIIKNINNNIKVAKFYEKRNYKIFYNKEYDKEYHSGLYNGITNNSRIFGDNGLNNFEINYTFDLNNLIRYLKINKLIVNNILNSCKNKTVKNNNIQIILYSYRVYLGNSQKNIDFNQDVKINKTFECIFDNNFKFPKCQFFGWCGNQYKNININTNVNQNITDYYTNRFFNTLYNNMNSDFTLLHKNDYQILFSNNNLDYKDLSSYYMHSNTWKFKNYFDIIYEYINKIILHNIDGLFIIVIDDNSQFNIYSQSNTNNETLKNIINFEQFCYDF
jgi:hypothetical protein